MSKKISDLTEEELNSMDLDELLLMSKEMQDSKIDNVSKTTETLKKAGSKTFDVSKQVASDIKYIAKNEYKNYKENYERNKTEGVDNWDDKLKKILDGYSPAAFIAKFQMNRNLKSALAEEQQEKGYTIKTAVKESMIELFGFKGYVFYYGAILVGLVLALQMLRTAIILLPFMYLVYKYIKTQIDYSKNAQYFDFKWYLDLIKMDEQYRGTNPRNTYLIIPSMLFNSDNELEEYLEKRGKKMGTGTNEYASIHNSRIEFDKRYGYIRVFDISNYFFRRTVKEAGLESVELNDYFLIPQKNNNSEFTKDVYFQVHSTIKQSIAPKLGLISRDEFIDLVVTDETINYAFPEIAEQLDAEKERLEEEEKERLAEEEEQKLYEAFAEKGLNDKAIKIVMKLKKNQEDWGISVRDLFGRSLKFSTDYLKVRADLMDNTTRQDVQKNVNKIAQKVGLMPKIQQAENESAIYLLFRLKNRIKSRELSWSEIIEDAKNGYVNLGAGILGDVKVMYPREDSPFFNLIGGISRSGKSKFNSRFTSGALHLQDENGFYDYQDVFIGSVKAIDDYVPLEWDKKGMVILDDPLKQYHMLQKIDEIAQQRVQVFQKADVVNIKEYNRKYPQNKMGKILLIMDEYKNTLTTAESIKIETGSGKKKLSEAIEDLLVKINSLHGSRGVNTIVITQSFAKNSVGRVRDTLGSQFLGYADKDVWNSIDKNEEMSKYMANKEDKRQGLFFMKAPDFELVEGTEVDKFNCGFVEISTHYISTEEIRDNFKRQFDTADKYLSSILNNDVSEDSTESSIEEMESIDLFD